MKAKFILTISSFLFCLSVAYAQEEVVLDAPVEGVLEDEDEVLNQLDRLNEISDGSLEFRSFIYSEKGRKNPFLRPGGLERADPKRDEEDKAVKTTGLEGYDISSFQLTAVMWDIKFPKALVRVSEKETYMIEEGTKIGRRDGYVAKIREGEVVIVEPSQQADEKSTTLYKTQVLKLGR
ncbi:MAG: pilus assembly protein PilP [Bdellovibrionales bacterium]